MDKVFQKVFNYVKSTEFLLTLTIVVSAVALLIIVVNLFKRIRKRTKAATATTVKVFSEIIKFTIIFGAFLLILQTNGVNVTSLFAGLGIASAVVGLALQDILRDIISGIHMAGDHFFSIGDGVEIDGTEGIVCGFNLRTTKIETIDKNHIISICNREVYKVRKLSGLFDIDVPLSYKEDVNRIFEIMKELAGSIGKIKGVNSCVFKGTEEFGASAVKYKIRISADPFNQPDIRREANKIIQDKLAEEGIRIPFSQLDVHLDGGQNG